jgi:pilus assembly protein CpaE
MTAITSFVAFASGDADLAVLKEFLAGRGLDTGGLFKGNIIAASEYLKNNASPDVLLVELPSQEEAPALLEQLSEVCDPNTKVITIGRINEYSFYCWLMDIGITQYLLSPLSTHALEAALLKLQGAAAEHAKDKPPSKLIAVMGARGGVGATSVAIDLAGILSEQTHKRIALVDLDPQEGTISLALDIQPTVGLRDVLEKPDRIDSLFLDRVMNKLGKYISVLSAEERFGEAIAISEHAATPLIQELKAKYDYIIIDMPRHMNAFDKACLQAADHALLICELNLLCLRDTLRMQDAMKELWKSRPPMVIANRIGLATKHEVPVLDFEKGINTKIACQILFAPDVFMPLGRDIPSVKHKSHPAMKPLYQFAAQFMPEAKPAPEKKATGFSLFKRKEG